MPPPAAPTARRTPAAPPRSAPAPDGWPPVGGRAVRRGVSWDEYAALRADPEHARVKLTYDGPAGGLLEIEMPQGMLHESVSRLLTLLIAAFAEERGLPFKAVGSVTQSREALDRGCEADESFFIGSLPKLRGDGWDLDRGDPPPDLSIEVDVTSPGVRKLPIYAALGVPEVWVWDGGAITVRRLGAGGYEIVVGSVELPGFPVELAAALTGRPFNTPDGELLAEFRAALAPAE